MSVGDLLKLRRSYLKSFHKLNKSYAKGFWDVRKDTTSAAEQWAVDNAHLGRRGENAHEVVRADHINDNNHLLIAEDELLYEVEQVEVAAAQMLRRDMLQGRISARKAPSETSRGEQERINDTRGVRTGVDLYYERGAFEEVEKVRVALNRLPVLHLHA